MSRYIHSRLYRGKDDDLINWLDSLPEGRRSQLVRDALRMGIGLLPPPASEQTDIALIVKQAVREVLAELPVIVAQGEGALNASKVEEAFGEQLDRLLDRFG